MTAVVVAVLGLLSSPVWGPPICRAIRVCGPEVAGTGSVVAVSAIPSTTASTTTTTAGSGDNADPTDVPSRPAPRTTSAAPYPAEPSTVPDAQVPGGIPTTTKPPVGSGYPYYAGDYCDEFVRAWQGGYRDRAADLSNEQIADLVFRASPPQHYRNEWGPTGEGAMCVILDTDSGNSQVVRLDVTGGTGRPGAITSAQF